MRSEQPSDRKRSPVKPAVAPDGETTDSAAPEPVKRFAGLAALNVLNSFLTLIAVIFIGAAGIFLTLAWIAGPQVWMQAAEYQKFTERADATIMESWVAVDLDQSRIRSAEFWRASAKASRCVVVEYGGDWGAPVRRAFCGPRLTFNESYTLADLRDIAPNVPFVWARDARGFAVAEIRLAASAQQWLATHPANTFMHQKWPAKSALEWLRVELDQPVNLAIAGWSSGPSTMKVAYDPQRPAAALPAATVDARTAHHFNWVAVLIGTTGGLLLWFKGMSILPWLANFTRTGRLVIAALPLVALPWFADALPDVLRSFNVAFAEIIGDMFGDVDPLDRMVASDPGDSAHADDARLSWRAGDDLYSDTFGRLDFTAPQVPFSSADAALAALVDAVTVQVTAMDEAGRMVLFGNLKRDKQNDLKGAGIVFMAAAKETLDDPQNSAQLRRAAKGFLFEWLSPPTEAFDQYSLAYRERMRLYARVADLPDVRIADPRPADAVAHKRP